MSRNNRQGTQTPGSNNRQNRRGNGSGSGGGNRRQTGRGGFAGPGRGNPQQRWHGGVRRRRPRNNNGAQRDRGHEQRLINQGILPEVEQIAFSATTNQSGQVTSAIAVNASRHGGRQMNVQARVDNVATGSRAVITNSGSALGTVADTVMAETGAPSVFGFVMPMNVTVFREQAIQSNTSTHRMFLGDSRIMAPAPASRPALTAPGSVRPAMNNARRHRERQLRIRRRLAQALNPEAASFVPGTESATVAAVDNGPALPVDTDAAVDNGPAPSANTNEAAPPLSTLPTDNVAGHVPGMPARDATMVDAPPPVSQKEDLGSDYITYSEDEDGGKKPDRKSEAGPDKPEKEDDNAPKRDGKSEDVEETEDEIVMSDGVGE